MVAGRLFLWSTAGDEWVSCPPDEVIWLDRTRLSDNEDLSLHRAPRCAGLRHVQHRWELFSRDSTYQVFLAPDDRAEPLSAEQWATPSLCGRWTVKDVAVHLVPTMGKGLGEFATEVLLEVGQSLQQG